MFLINSKTKFKVLYLDFVFTSIWKVKFKQLISIFIFSNSFFIKKRKTKYSLFFVFMKKLKKELLKKIKINFMVIFTSMVYTLSKCKFVSSPLRISAVQWSLGHQESAVWKQLMYFNVYIAGCYFHICFILTVNCDVKHTSRSRYRQVFS